MTAGSPPPSSPPLGIFRLVIVVTVLGTHVAVVPDLLGDGCRSRSSSRGVLRRKSIVRGIDVKLVIVRIYDLSGLVDIHLLGIIVNVVVLLLLGFVFLR